MIQADPNAGVYYVCNPNNPTGTLTPRRDIEYLLAHKQQDVVVLRTFSKIYGMAGMRAGMAYGRPDLLAQLAKFGRTGNLSVVTMACAAASMKANATIMPERIANNRKNRELAFEHLDKKGVGYIPSQTNFFMMSIKVMSAVRRS